MSEQPTRRQNLDTIRQAFASQQPIEADAHGKTDLDRRLDTERGARLDESLSGAYPPADTPPVAPTGMRPNPAQGRASSGTPVQGEPTGTPAERIRARITDAGDAAFDDGSRNYR